jgi:hypothetical protein
MPYNGVTGTTTRCHNPDHNLNIYDLCVLVSEDHLFMFGSISPRHGRPCVADCRYGLQICRASTNILSKQSRTAEKWWSSSLGLDKGLKTPHRKKIAIYEM